jgi:histone-arginine methyltransferase CARM1
VKSNKVDTCIKVISGKIEEIELPEKVDMIISEPMGYMLLNERMLETYLHAKKWLKPDGKMFPTRGDLHVAPFTDEALYMEQVNKVNFWYQDFFHGVNLSALRNAAMDEYFRQPIVDTFDIRICLAKTQRHVIDFATTDETELHRIEIPLEFHMLQSGTVHGLAFWFDVAFIGTGATVWLSTAPTEPLTHWYQVRCLLKQPIFAKQGQVLTGRVLMIANTKQSYDVTIECMIMGTTTKSTNSLDLKNPYFRYTGVQPPAPPGENQQSPSEAYWTQVDMQGARQAVNLVNGMIVDGLGHVSLDSGSSNTVQGNAFSQANIHQGSIPATGRIKEKSQQATNLVTPMSAANSLQFNQLIGGAISPSVISQQNGSASTSTSTVVSPTTQNQHLMIGDYAQGMSNVMSSSPFRQQ